MKLIFHLLLKDLRALRWLVLAWAVLLAVLLWICATGNPMYPSNLSTILVRAVLQLEWILSLLAAFLLMHGLMYQDPVADARAFWLTRPIPAWMLLVSKLLTFSLICLVPVLAGIPWWINTHIPYGHMVTLAITTWFYHMAIGIAALPIAVTIKQGRAHMNRQILFGLVIVLACIACGVLIFSSDWFSELAFGNRKERIFTAASYALIASLAMMACQMLSRRILLTSLTGICGLALVFGSLSWDGLRLWRFKSLSHVSWPAAAKGDIELLSRESLAKREVGLARLNARMRLPAGAIYASATIESGTWTESGISNPIKGYSLGIPDDAARKAAVLGAPMNPAVIEDVLRVRSTDTEANAALRAARKLKPDAPAQLKLDLHCWYAYPRIDGEMLLKEGQIVETDDYRLELGHATGQGRPGGRGSIAVSMVQSGCSQVRSHVYLVNRKEGWIEELMPTRSTWNKVHGVVIIHSDLRAAVPATPLSEQADNVSTWMVQNPDLRLVVANFPAMLPCEALLEVSVPFKPSTP